MDLAPALERGVAIIEEGPLELDDLLLKLATKAAHELEVSPRTLHEALRLRERVHSTALPGGVAVPHAIVPGLPRTLVVPALVRQGVPSGTSVVASTIFIGLFGDVSRPWDHVKMLARVARIAHDASSLARIRAAMTPDNLVRSVMSEDAAHQ